MEKMTKKDKKWSEIVGKVKKGCIGKDEKVVGRLTEELKQDIEGY